MAQNLVWSTHDWTVSTLTVPFAEAWVDVKMPGGFPALGSTPDARRTYVVGTIEAVDLRTGADFSGFSANTGGGGIPEPQPAAPRQVVMLQCNQTTSAGSTAQLWQRFYFGLPDGTNQPRSTNARAVSVWEAPTDDDRRIAICGETYDDLLHASNAGAPWTGAGTAGATGFLAVYNGLGQVQWSHHFFSDNSPTGVDPSANCVITDLSIRVDAGGNDVVTYCGMFTYGDPGSGTPLSPLRPFAIPAPLTGLAGGATTHAPGQWDGFVGRLVRSGTTTTQVFHSIVGGPGQDGLFGLVEIDADRFAVVGVTAGNDQLTGDLFPLEYSTVAGSWTVGAVLVFDAAAIDAAPPGNLEWIAGRQLGSQDPAVWTIARDVALGRNVTVGTWDAVLDALYVVGTTNDPAFSTQIFSVAAPGWQEPPPAGQDALQGPTDGFLAAVMVVRPPFSTTLGPLVPWTYSYWGAADATADDGLTGVSTWSEFPDQVVVGGYSTTTGNRDMRASSFFFNTAFGTTTGTGSTAFANDTEQLHRIRDIALTGIGTTMPTALGTNHATTGFQTNDLAAASGGGIAMGNDGRINFVGQSIPAVTGGTGYPLAGGGRAADAGPDAVRSEFDLLPDSEILPRIGRTDGTGFQDSGVGPYPPPPATASGGTTPTCLLAAYGVRIGEPLPLLQRMLIDYQGPAPDLGVSDAAIAVSRPGVDPGSLALSVLQVGLPPAVPWLVIDGAEFWLGDPLETFVVLPDFGEPDRPLRYRLAQFTGPGYGVTSSAQLLCLLSTAIGSGTCTTSWVNSPTLWFTF